MEISNSNLELCLNYIESGKCILFLGPQFAMDADGNKIHDLIKAELEATGFKDKLDFYYKNLYIFKTNNPRGADKMKLNLALKKAYQKVTPHPIYKSIARIPFQAVIVAAPDRFLFQAYEDQHIESVFQYYSRKGNQSSPIGLDPGTSVVYNIFGDLEDEGSLMNSFKDFYQFIIAILGDQHQLPLELRNRIVNSPLFVFLGFDMTQWFFPLLIQKLNSFKGENEDATAFINKDNGVNSGNEWYFPIEVMVSEKETMQLINALYDNLEKKDTLLKPGEKGEQNPMEALKTLVSHGDYNEVFTGLKDYCQTLGKSKDDVIMVEVRHVELMNRQSFGTISEADKKLELAQITHATLGLINEFFDA